MSFSIRADNLSWIDGSKDDPEDLELDVEIRVGDFIERVEYDYPTFHLTMDCFWCEVACGDLKLLEADEAKWLSKGTLHSVQWLPADIALIEKIEKQMGAI